MAHGSVAMRGCVTYIQDPPLTSRSIYRVFDKSLGPTLSFVCFDISIPYLAHGSITMRECVMFIPVSDAILTFDLKVFIRFMT